MKVFHLIPGVSLGFLDTGLENKYLFLFCRIFLLLLSKSSFYPLEDFHIILTQQLVSIIRQRGYAPGCLRTCVTMLMERPLLPARAVLPTL